MNENALVPPPRLTIRPKSDIDRMTLVSALALFGIKFSRAALSVMDQEEKDWVLRDCRAVFLKQMKLLDRTYHSDHGGDTRQAQRLNLTFDRVTHLLGPKLLFVPHDRAYEEPEPEPRPPAKTGPPAQSKPARTVKQRPCVVCGNQCTKGRSTCSDPCLAQRRAICNPPEQKLQKRVDYLARTRLARKKVAAAWWAAHATEMADKRKSRKQTTIDLSALNRCRSTIS